MRVFKIIWCVLGLIGESAVAAPAELGYQGRIIKTDGTPLEYSNVSFQFEITNPNGSCVIYREQLNGVNMVNSNGVFDAKIGGSHSFPSSPTFNILDVFNNNTTFLCDGGATFTPALNEGRRLRVQFHDGSAWRVISPDTVIRSVPFAGYASNASKLGDKFATEYVIKNEINSNTSCGGGSFLTWNATTQTFGCSVGSGGVSALTGDVTASGSGSVAATISSGAVTTAKIADGNVTGVKLENSGVSAGTYPKVTVDAKGRVTAGSALVASDIPSLDAAKITSGVFAPTRMGTGTADNTTYLRGDGTWATVAGSSGTVTSITAGTGLTGGTITGSGTIGLGTELAGVNALGTTGFVRRTGAGTYTTNTSIDLASQITGTLPIANGGTGATTAIGALTNILPTQTGNAGKVLQTDGANVTWETPASSGITALTGDVTASGSGSVAATIASGAVTTAKIADGNVTGVKLENSGVTAGTYGSASLIPSFTVDAKGRITSVSTNSVSGLLPAASGASGKYLKSDGTNWAGSDVLYTDIKNAGGLAAFAGSACAANQALGWSSVTDSFVCQAIGSLNASAITAGTIATARLGSGTADNTTYLRGDGTWATVSTADATKLPLAGGTMAGTINMNGNQITNIGNVPFVATNPAVGQDGQSLRWNNTAGQWEWFTAGAAGAGISTINGLNGSAQTLAPSSSATTYGFSSAGSTHTLSIPSASTAGVTAGTISKTEYDAFNAKQAAGNYITTMTGDVTSSGFTAGSVTTTIANNAVTTAKINDNAVTTAKIADGNVTGVKLENSGVTAGTYPKVTVDAKGRVTAGASLSASDIPNLDAAKITSGVLDVARLGTGTADNTTYLRGDGTWATVSGSSGTVTSITAGAGLTGGTITSSGTIGLGTELTGVNSLATTGFVRRTGAGTYATSSSIDLASQITGTLPIANGGTGATNAAAALANLLPTQTGNNGKVLQTDGATATWVTPSASGITALTGDVTASGSGSVAATIANDAITSAKIANATIVGADLDFTGVNSANTNFVMKDNTGKFYDFACSTTGHVPTWTVSGFACQAPSLTETDPEVGANTTNYVSKWNGSALVASGIIEDGSGRVGIGTPSPDTGFHVRFNGSGTGVKFENTSTFGPRFLFTASGAGGREYSFSSTANSNAAGAGKLVIADETAAVGRLVIDSAGNVGIGNTAPTAKLEVTGQVKITGGTPGAGKVLTSDASGLATWETPVAGGSGTVTSITAGTGLTGGTITGSGTVGLGTELAGLNAVSTTGYIKRTAAGTFSTPAIDLSSDITGTLPITNGGTGATNAAAALTNLLPAQAGNNGKVLQTDGTSATWVTPAASGITALTGDVTASGTGSVAATIANNAVTSAKIANATIVGADMDFTGVNSATTNFVMKDSTGKFYDFACSTTGHIPTWTVSGFACQAPTGGGLPAADGTAGAPGIAFTNDPDTGLYLAGSNILGITTGGSAKWAINDKIESVTSSGARIGGSSDASSPTYSFKDDPNLGIFRATTDVLAFTTAGTERMRIDASGNVAIGTTSTAYPLTVVDATSQFAMISGLHYRGSGTPLIQATTTSANPTNGQVLGSFGLGNSSALNISMVSASMRAVASENWGAGNGTRLDFNTVANGSSTLTTRMTVGDDGNVGIGTISPGTKTKLSVEGQIRSKSGSTTTGAIDWSAGNAITTSFDCGSNITFDSLRDGGSYTLVVTGAGTTQCNFSTSVTGDDAATVTYRFNPANAVRTASSHTVYSMMRVGNIVYVSWITGF